jgi:hypothetical protein
LKKRTAALTLILTLSAVAAGQTSRAPGRAPSRLLAADSPKAKVAGDEVDRLLELCHLAQGGDALDKLGTRVMRGHIEMSDSPLTGSFEKYLKRPRKAMMVANTPRGQILDVSDGVRSWVQTPWGTAVSTGYGDEVMARPASGKGGPRWREDFSAASLKGRGYVDGHEVIILAGTLHGRPPMLWHIDARTGLLRKLKFANPVAGAGDERLLAVYFDSYATVDGVKVPALIRQVYTSFTLTFRVTEVKHNIQIDDALFANPNGK